MKNIDIETFHKRIRNTIDIASSYIGNKKLNKLIISCRLKPKSLFDDLFKPNKLELVWLDEFDNELVLEKNQATIRKIVENRKNPDMNKSTDLFRFRSLLDALEDSKGICISDSNIIFVGRDEYLRCFSLDGKRKSPLEFGLDNLFDLLGNINVRERDLGKIIIYSLPNQKIKEMIEREFNNE